MKAKIGKAMRMFILGGANVAIGRTMYVLQKVTLNIILDPDFFGKNSLRMKSFHIIPLLLISYFVPSMEGTECSGTHTFTGQWGSTSNGKFQITVPKATSEWTITVSYSKPINSINAYQGAEESCDGTICTFTNEAWNGQQTAGATLNLGYGIQYDTTDDYPQVTGFAFNGVPSCEEGDTAVITTQATIDENLIPNKKY